MITPGRRVVDARGGLVDGSSSVQVLERMFGIGAGEMAIILILLLIAVGPDRMPGFMKAVGKGVKEFRKTARDLRSTVGIDEILADDDFRDPLGMRKPARPRAAKSDSRRAARPEANPFDDAALDKEQPAEGVDIAFMRAKSERSGDEG